MQAVFSMSTGTIPQPFRAASVGRFHMYILLHRAAQPRGILIGFVKHQALITKLQVYDDHGL
jgi:hypothetical protein